MKIGKNNMKMKKLIIIGILLMIICQACYDDYKKDFEYTATYFALQKPHRILIPEEGQDLSFEIGVVLGGKYMNEVDETVFFEIDPDLVPGSMEILPENYYTLSDNERFIIPAGEFLGKITVTMDESFLDDQEGTRLNYVLPLRITDATTDSILSNKSTTIVAVEFENEYYGAYWITGSDFLIDIFGNAYDTVVYSEPDLVKNNYRIFNTIAKDTSSIDYFGSDFSRNNSLRLAFNPDGSILLAANNATNLTEISGTGTYNKEQRKIYLDYSYKNPENFTTHHAMDTLIYFDTPQELKEW